MWLLFISLLACVSGQVQAQSFSNTFDIALDLGDFFVDMDVSNDTIFALSVGGCDTVECYSVVKLFGSEDPIGVRKVPWMDEGDKDALLVDDSVIVVAGSSNATAQPTLDLLVLNRHLDSLRHVAFPVPDSIIGIGVRSIVRFQNFYVAVGFGFVENGQSSPALSFWIEAESMVLDTIIDSHLGDQWTTFTQAFVMDSQLIMSFLVDTSGVFLKRGFLKYNLQQEKIWSWISEAESHGLRGEDAIVLSNGNLIIEHAVDNSDREFRLICVTPEGEELWTYDDQRHPFGRKYLYHLTEAANGDIIGCGELHWPWDPSNMDPKQVEGYTGAYLFRLDSQTGIMKWERAIIGYDSLWNYAGDFFTDIDELSDGSLIMCGGWRIYDSTQLVSYDSWLVRTDDEGCVISDCNFTSFTTATNEPETTPSRSMRMFPNPSRDQVQIVLPEVNPWSEDVTYLVHNMSGQHMISTGSSVIDLSALPNGVYQITAVGRRGRVLQTGKVVKVD
ncbi:MAG: T9SS type A sorting domain-containing protein [Saprospiraceae bacterium]|nr:T9SS type A sorting domain-containing protein [Saprospiraceae bacterium]